MPLTLVLHDIQSSLLFSRGCLLPAGDRDRLCWVPNCGGNLFCQAVIPQTITFSSYCLNVSVLMSSNPDPRMILYRGRIFRKWLRHKSTVFVSEIGTQEKTSQLASSFLQVRISWDINRLQTAKKPLIREQPAWRPDHRILANGTLWDIILLFLSCLLYRDLSWPFEWITTCSFGYNSGWFTG